MAAGARPARGQWISAYPPNTNSSAISRGASANPKSRRCVDEAEETETFPVEIFRKWGDLGLFGIRYPEADGGSGMDKVADCIVREEISAVRRVVRNRVVRARASGAVADLARGTASRRNYFKPGLAGRKIGAFALSEPDTGSNIRELTTKPPRSLADIASAAASSTSPMRRWRTSCWSPRAPGPS